ncbi:mechanosensitive ion channel family protein [Sneathiella sp.]|uniref:mechanosensitive ion channel family protein n=1 Tax=Sneathiella sp. TaxID=1964365 RepID=UPI0025F7535C|nr:mechanosensitive ion channel family protein [Sneathiella sp.]
MFVGYSIRSLVLGLLVALLISPTAFAQSTEGGTERGAEGNAAAIEKLIDQARSDGSTIVVIGGPQSAEAAPAAPGMEERALETRQNLLEVVEESPAFPERFVETILALDPHSGGDIAFYWPFAAVATTVLFLIAGYIAERLFRRWAQPHFDYFCTETPENREEKITYLLFRGLLQTLGLALQGVLAILLVIAFDRGNETYRLLQGITVIGFVSFRLALIFARSFLAPHSPRHRLVALDTTAAQRLYRSGLVMSALLTILITLNIWSESLGLDPQSAQLCSIVLTLATLLVKSVFVFVRRREVAEIILGHNDPAAVWKPRLLLARLWHGIAILYFLITAFLTIGWIAQGQPNALGLTNLPIIAVFSGLAAYGAALLIIDYFFVRRVQPPTLATAAPAPADADPDAVFEMPMKPRKTFKGLAEKTAAISISAAVIWWIYRLWGIDLTVDGSLVNRFWEVLLITFFSYLAYEAVKIAIDRKLEDEGALDAAEPERGEEGGANAASRLATLLPLFRNFLLVVIIVIGGMIILSELGVDIAPLFAGAGVIGLAIGFGAQTLIRDIFSGAFFLLDDAFRKGEYISLGSVKGTVEKISIRSMQLRHHLGPLNTVPFGEIQQVTNYSRDWVMMKLPLRLTYDTDVEKVRKLIKKLGQELLEHPEVGDKFMEPLKSQGVFMMEDSAMIIRVKFMTRPGDQFVIRKLVYARIRELFEENGIKFAHREVTVRVADEEGNDHPMSEARKKAIAGAVQPAIEDAAGATNTPDKGSEDR